MRNVPNPERFLRLGILQAHLVLVDANRRLVFGAEPLLVEDANDGALARFMAADKDKLESHLRGCVDVLFRLPLVDNSFQALPQLGHGLKASAAAAAVFSKT